MRRITYALILFLLVTTGAAFAGQPCDKDPENCVRDLKAKISHKAWLGVEMEKNGEGLPRITQVVADSPAAAAGLQVGDVILAVGGLGLQKASKEEMVALKKSLGPNQKVAYKVLRSGSKHKLAVNLGRVPTEVMAQWIGEHMLAHHMAD